MAGGGRFGRTAGARSTGRAPRASRGGLQRRALQVRREDRFGGGERLHLEQPLAQLRGPRHPLRVPAEVLAELDRRLARVSLEPQRQSRVLQRRREPLGGLGVRALGPAREQIAALREDPPIPEGAARRAARMMRPTSPRSLRQPEPPLLRTTFLTGQPKLMSMKSGRHTPVTISAARAMTSASAPYSWMPIGRSASSNRISWNRCWMPRATPTAEMNSDTTTSAPARRHSSRNGDSDTPAMGARNRGTSCAVAYGNFMRDNVMARCAASNLSLRYAPVTTRSDHAVQLREFFVADAIQLHLASTTKDDVLKELVGLLKLDDKAEATLFKMLRRRETLGSTGIGQGIAIPHCRSLVVDRLRVAFGRKLEGIDFKAIDDKAVHYFFLIVAPPLEVSNQYLPVLGKIAQFAKEPDVPTRLAKLKLATEFLELLEEKNI